MKYAIINLRIKKRTVIIYEQYKVAGRYLCISWLLRLQWFLNLNANILKSWRPKGYIQDLISYYP